MVLVWEGGIGRGDQGMGMVIGLALKHESRFEALK